MNTIGAVTEQEKKEHADGLTHGQLLAPERSTEDLCYIFTQDSDTESELQLWT